VNGVETIQSEDFPLEELDRAKSTATTVSTTGTSAAQTRRAKNAAHRADDVGEYLDWFRVI
jgi:flavin-binding protein dodecin